MAEPLKKFYNPELVRRLANTISGVSPTFPSELFITKVLTNFEPLELVPRARKIADGLFRHLPDNYPEAIEILLASLGPTLESTESFGMEPFFYMPHGIFIAEHGLDDFELSMRAQYELTQRFSAEFCIRPFLEKYPENTLTQLEEWTRDPSPHVRRLVSEGTRPRLPWAPRLRVFENDPTPVLPLLERLKDDPELYVRRSVANHLNDIGKDHPKVMADTARRWLRDADEQRRWVVRHALRSAVKRADPVALEILGFGAAPQIVLEARAVTPARATIGDVVVVSFTMASRARQPQSLMVDFRIHYVKANGESRPKVFKLKTLDLPKGGSVSMKKKVSVADMSTRKHYPGDHSVDVVVNGQIFPLGGFELTVD